MTAMDAAKIRHFFAPGPYQGIMENHLFPVMYTFLSTLLEGLTQGLRKPLKIKRFSAPAPNQGSMKNHLFPEMYTILPALLQGLTQGLRKTNKNRALFRSSALPGLNEKPSFSRDVYKSAAFAPGPYPGLKENH